MDTCWTPAESARRSGAHAIRLARVGCTVAARLCSVPAEAGQVHSVFDRALNVAWHDGRLLALHGPGPLAAPFAAALERWPGPWASARSPVRRRGDLIEVGGARIDWSAAALVDTRMPMSAGGPSPALRQAVAHSPGRHGDALDGARARRARRRMAEGVARRDTAEFLGGALALIGLGEGLTPAGDDCVVGALAVAHRFAGPWLGAHPEIGAELARAAAVTTTAVAAEFISHAAAGHFAESLLDLLTADGLDAARGAVDRLLRAGATSGADTAAGVRLALDAL